ncbi:hypothetical protein [Spiroplasma endosymbiont of Tricholauxania praeusta]|uniref:hypothetical protein n=1 Tax=Spiroplasma endosymbiont of Tricholauxania praeusta TaxID=3066296 RepID=UPI0030D5CE59
MQDLLSNETFNYNLNKRFLICITNLIFDVIKLDHFKNSNETFLNLLKKECFREFQKELQEIYSSNFLATFFNSIVELFYLDKTKFGIDYYNEINKIIKEKRKEIKINEIIYNEYGKISYLLWPWHFIDLESLWIIENFNNNCISIEKIKFIYDEISLNLEKIDEKYQSKVKEKMNYIIDKLNLKFKKL